MGNGVLLLELCAILNPKVFYKGEQNKKVCTYDRRGHWMKSRLIIAGSEVNVRSRAQKKRKIMKNMEQYKIKQKAIIEVKIRILLWWLQNKIKNIKYLCSATYVHFTTCYY